MATTNIDGKEYEVLTYTDAAYSTATATANLAVETLGSFSSQEKYIIKVATNTQVTAVSLVINIVTEDDKFRAVALTAGGYAAGEATATVLEAVVAFTAAALGLTVSAPVAIGIGIVGIGVGLYTSSLGAKEGGRLYNLGHIWYEKNFKMKGRNTIVRNKNGTTTISTTKTLEQSLEEFQSILDTQDQIVDLHATIPSVSNPDNFKEQLKYDSVHKLGIVKTDPKNKVTLTKSVTYILEKDVSQITINNQTSKVYSSPKNLQLRNAIDSIADVQFLLSNILIKTGG